MRSPRSGRLFANADTPTPRPADTVPLDAHPPTRRYVSPTGLLLGFLIRFVVVFGLLIFPSPAWNELYSQGFRAVGNAVFGRDDENCLLYFEGHRQTKGFSAVDTRIVIGNRQLVDSNGKGPVALLVLNTRSVGWLPTALTVALIVATPVPLLRRCRALLWGALLIHAFVLVSVAVYIWNQSTTVSLVTLSPFWKGIADALEYTLVTQMGISFSIPVLIWITVLFRRQDVKTFVLTQARKDAKPIPKEEKC